MGPPGPTFVPISPIYLTEGSETVTETQLAALTSEIIILNPPDGRRYRDVLTIDSSTKATETRAFIVINYSRSNPCVYFTDTGTAPAGASLSSFDCSSLDNAFYLGFGSTGWITIGSS